MAQGDNTGKEKLLVTLKVFEHVFGFLKVAAKTVGWVFAAISAADIAKSVAGRSTELSILGQHDILVSFWSGFDLSCLWAWGLAIVAIAYGLLQARLRRRKTAYLSDRIEELEMQIDPQRTTSGLTKTGDTPKGG